MRGTDDAGFFVSEQDRTAVGGGDADREARSRGYDRIGARRVLAGPWLRGDDHVGRMNLIAAHQMSRRHAERRGHARTVLAHFFRRIARADAAVEARVEALGYATLAGEEGVGAVGRGGGGGLR